MSDRTREGRGDLIDGAWALPPGDDTLAPPSPAARAHTPFITRTSVAHAEAAVAAAVRAKDAWRRAPEGERAAALLAYRDRLRARRDELERAISAAIGKPRWESKTEVDAMIAKVELSLGPGLELLKLGYPAEPNTRLRRRPLGVALVLGPFNFPGHLANGHLVPALATGNAVVFKPSERAPEVGELMALCLLEAGFPAGVVNVVQGGADVAAALVAQPGVDAVMFTGSTAVGRRILAASAAHPGRMVALELGGRNPALVLDDADLTHAAREIAFAAYVTAGQRCTANSRVLVHRSRADELIERLARAATLTRVGPPSDPGCFLGPVIDDAAVRRALSMIERSRDRFDARVPAASPELDGSYLRPSLYVHRERAGRAGDVPLGLDELFAPVLTVEVFDDDGEATSRANEGEYGLAAAVFTASQARFERVAEELDVGLCNWNRSTVGSSSRLPFGGRKSSGNHRPAGLASSLYCVDAVAELHVPAPPADAQPAPGFVV
ncbi:MAG: aldehyde dehydrogenase family protein [Polyangiaceae bacterium]|nr:aldehyde dehydrogenase family protein [Polyangiaceae bacterium]